MEFFLMTTTPLIGVLLGFVLGLKIGRGVCLEIFEVHCLSGLSLKQAIRYERMIQDGKVPDYGEQEYKKGV